MTGVALGFSSEKTTVPAHRGERVAAWIEDYLRVQRCSVAEIAFRIRQDRRDVQRLLDTKSCGHRLEDALAAYFGWPFVEAVMAPVIDNSIEAEIARERAEIAAREERLARLERARKGHRTRSWAVASEDGAGASSSRLGA
jgi:hypothetical protein